jgi:hypothetical protein
MIVCDGLPRSWTSNQNIQKDSFARVSWIASAVNDVVACPRKMSYWPRTTSLDWRSREVKDQNTFIAFQSHHGRTSGAVCALLWQELATKTERCVHDIYHPVLPLSCTSFLLRHARYSPPSRGKRIINDFCIISYCHDWSVLASFRRPLQEVGPWGYSSGRG